MKHPYALTNGAYVTSRKWLTDAEVETLQQSAPDGFTWIQED